MDPSENPDKILENIFSNSNTFQFSQSRRSDVGIKRQKTRIETADIIVALDGTGDFDNIQSAIDFLKDGGTVQIKEGTYIITETIEIPANINLIGNGNVNLKTNNNITMIRISNNIAGAVYNEVRNIKFMGNSSATNGTGINLNNCSFIKILNCKFERLENGINNYDAYNIEITGCIFDEYIKYCIKGWMEKSIITNNSDSDGSTTLYFIYLNGENNFINNNISYYKIYLECMWSVISNNKFLNLENDEMYPSNIALGNQGTLTETVALKQNGLNSWN